MYTDKANSICILQILKEYSDEDHILQMKDIIERMNKDYQLSPDRRTVYSAIALLIDLKYDISLYEENGKGYYLRSRNLELSEILLIADAIYSCPFITSKQSDDLVRKVQSELSMYKRKQYKNITVSREERKGNNKEVFLNIEVLDEAISEKRKVSFTYLEYNTDKKLVPRRKEAYVTSPYGMVYLNEHYYLICLKDNKEETSLYRIDRMRDIQILDEKSVAKKVDKAQIQNTIYAYLGEPESIKLRVDRSVLSDVIDKFGTDIIILDEGDDVIISFTAPPRGIKFWALQYITNVEVLEPKWLRREVIEAVKANRYDI